MDRCVPHLSGLPHLPVPHLHVNRPFVSISPDFRDCQKIERIESREKRLRESLGLKDLIEDINGAIQKYCYMLFLTDCKFCMRNTIG